METFPQRCFCFLYCLLISHIAFLITISTRKQIQQVLLRQHANLRNDAKSLVMANTVWLLSFDDLLSYALILFLHV